MKRFIWLFVFIFVLLFCGAGFAQVGYNYSNYLNVSESVYNPYVYSFLYPLYAPHAYDARFPVYSGQVDAGMAYSNYLAGLYNYSVDTSVLLDRNIYTWGYPFPYAQMFGTGWDVSMAAGFNALYGFNCFNSFNRGNIFNLYYNPWAFTFDLGLEAYRQGIMNFFQGLI